MNLKKINDFFAYAFFTVGAVRAIYTALAFMEVGINIGKIFNGGKASSTSILDFGVVIGWAQIILTIGAVVMIILNREKRPQVITGYLLAIGALALEIITPSILLIFIVFVICSMYMKAGSTIKKNNAKH